MYLNFFRFTLAQTVAEFNNLKKHVQNIKSKVDKVEDEEVKGQFADFMTVSFDNFHLSKKKEYFCLCLIKHTKYILKQTEDSKGSLKSRKSTKI